MSVPMSLPLAGADALFSSNSAQKVLNLKICPQTQPGFAIPYPEVATKSQIGYQVVSPYAAGVAWLQS